MVTKDIRYIGVDDKELDLFEGQYRIPSGISYNSYVILDEKIAVMDAVDCRKAEEFMANLDQALEGRKPDYLVVQHMEPDHASSVKAVVDKYPEVTVVATAPALRMLPLYFEGFSPANTLAVKEGDTLELGRHQLTFRMAPMVHWPEVMVTYDSTDKILFSADAFGTFGALDAGADWDREARRYYFNIVGKFGPQVQALLKKTAALDVQIICPLHGPVLKENLAHYLGRYDLWSRYEPESEGVFIAYASMHGNTAAAARKLAGLLEEKGCPKVVLSDLARDDMSEALANAFRYGKVALCAPTYNGGVAAAMEDFLHHLAAKNYQKRTVGLVENGSWAPAAAKGMRGALEGMKEVTVLEPAVTIKGAVKSADLPALEALADALLN